MDKYEVLSEIGKGSFGTVSKIVRKSDRQILIWKELYYEGIPENEKELISNEISLLKEMNHPNIVNQYEVINDDSNSKLYIVMEYCDGGDLDQLIQKSNFNKTRIDENFIWKILIQTLKALNYIHNEKNILHRDIKPSNIFLYKNYNIKLGDFGLSRKFYNEYAKTIIGTPLYMSPELLERKPYNEKADIWALGCSLYELSTFSTPYEAPNMDVLLNKIRNGLPQRIDRSYSNKLWNIISKMLTYDYNKRPSSLQLIEEYDELFVSKKYINIDRNDIQRKWEELNLFKQQLDKRDKEQNEKEKELIKRENQLKELYQKLEKQKREQNIKDIQLKEREKKLNEKERKFNYLDSNKNGNQGNIYLNNNRYYLKNDDYKKNNNINQNNLNNNNSNNNQINIDKERNKNYLTETNDELNKYFNNSNLNDNGNDALNIDDNNKFFDQRNQKNESYDNNNNYLNNNQLVTNINNNANNPIKINYNYYSNNNQIKLNFVYNNFDENILEPINHNMNQKNNQNLINNNEQKDINEKNIPNFGIKEKINKDENNDNNEKTTLGQINQVIDSKKNKNKNNNNNPFIANNNFNNNIHYNNNNFNNINNYNNNINSNYNKNNNNNYQLNKFSEDAPNQYLFYKNKKLFPEIGLIDNGDTSFLNVILNILGNIEELALYFLNPKKIEYFDNTKTLIPISYEMKKFFQNYYPKHYNKIRNNNYYNPYSLLYKIKSLRKVLKNPIYFLKDLFSIINTELLPEYKDEEIFFSKKCDMENSINNCLLYFEEKNKTPIFDIFSFYKLKESKCNHCNSSNFHLKYSFMLNLSIYGCYSSFENKKHRITIEDCLNYQLKNPKEYHKYFCEKCKQNIEIVSQIYIYSSPNIFLILLDRGNNFDENNNELLKIPFLIEGILDLKKFIKNKKYPTKYELVGIVSITLSDKKYVANCKSPIDNNWYYFNDSKVQKIEFNNVIKTNNNINYYVPCILVYKSVNNN